MWPSCHCPYISLPMPHHFTLNGSGCPCCARSRPMGVATLPFTYSTHWAARVRIAEPGVHADVGLAAQQPVQRQDLERADVVLLDHVPRVVPARRPPVLRANAIVPVVAGRDVAAPADVRGIDLLELRDQVGAEPLDVVRGHQRGRADPQRARARAGDLQPAVTSGPTRRERRTARCDTQSQISRGSSRSGGRRRRRPRPGSPSRRGRVLCRPAVAVTVASVASTTRPM